MPTRLRRLTAVRYNRQVEPSVGSARISAPRGLLPRSWRASPGGRTHAVDHQTRRAMRRTLPALAGENAEPAGNQRGESRARRVRRRPTRKRSTRKPSRGSACGTANGDGDRKRPKTAKATFQGSRNEAILAGRGKKRQARCMRHETDDDGGSTARGRIRRHRERSPTEQDAERRERQRRRRRRHQL